jgi:hypothetical protein
MNAAFDRDALLDAFDRIGRAAILAGTKLQIAVYGGSALMLASNLRFATEDVDVSELEHPLPEWLATIVHQIAEKTAGTTTGSTTGSHFISVLSRIARPTIWNMGHFRGTELRRDLRFRFHRRNICLR